MVSENKTNPYLAEDLNKIGASFGKLGLVGSTIMVTGATGLIGSIIVKAAAAYNESHPGKVNIMAFARNREKAELIFGDALKISEFHDNDDNPIRFVFADICTPIDDDISCDYIIHTANSTSSKQFVTEPVEVIESIYVGTRYVLEYAGRTNVKGVVYLSSMEVFGIVDCERPVSENELGYLDINNIRSCYSEGKRMAECMCSCYAKEYNVPVRIARLAQTFGAGIFPWEGRVFAQFARSAIRNEDIVLHTTGESFGNYVYTADAVNAILLLLKEGNQGETYTVANEESTMQIRELADVIVESVGGTSSQIVFDIPKENEFGYAPDTKLRLSSHKIQALGWKPETGMREAILRMLPDLK